MTISKPQNLKVSKIITSVGHISLWTSDVLPKNWKICNGDPLKINEYPELYNIIGYNFNPAYTNTDEFALPNLVEKIAIGKTNGDSIGGTIGANKKTIIKNNLDDHTHEVSVEGGNHDHRYYSPGGLFSFVRTGIASAYSTLSSSFAYNTNEEGNDTDRILLTGDGDDANKGGTDENGIMSIPETELNVTHTHPISEYKNGNITGDTGSVEYNAGETKSDFDVLQSSIALNYIIKVK
jgi:microcystin-dependent protein